MNEPFFKGSAHHAALIRNLGGSVAHTNPGQNVAVKIRNNTRDETLEPARRTSLNEEGTPKTTAEHIDHLHRTEGNRGKNRGAFDKLRARVRDAIANGEMAKAVPYKPGDYSIERAMSDLRRVPMPNTAGSLKTLRKSMAKVARSMGNATLAKSLDAGYGSNSATLTGGSALRKQSLDKRLQSTVVGGDPELTGEHILKAAGAALYAGQIDAQDAQAIQHHVNMTGKCPEPLLKKLRGEDVPSVPNLLTKAQCRAAASKGLETGRISSAEAMHCDTALSLDRPVDDGIMAKLKAIHGGKQ